MLLKQFHLGDGDIAVKANIDIGLGSADAQVIVASVIQADYFFGSRSAGIFVACQATACHLFSRFTNVPVLK